MLSKDGRFKNLYIVALHLYESPIKGKAVPWFSETDGGNRDWLKMGVKGNLWECSKAGRSEGCTILWLY